VTDPLTPLSAMFALGSVPTPAIPACVQSVCVTIRANVTGVAMLGAAKTSPASAATQTLTIRARRRVLSLIFPLPR
jgi:hypothetical protein